MKAYKVFNPDWTCNDFRYEIGKSYHCDGKIELCSNGFHACEKTADCFKYYSFDNKNHVAEVELSGTILTSDDGKLCASDISIIKEIDWQTVLKMVNDGKNCTGLCNSGDCNSGNRNSGNWNSGNCNSGNCNSGNCNSGDCNSGNCNSGNRNSGNWNSGNCNSGNWNSGDCNSGDRNSGNWNSGDCNSGFFNTKEFPVKLFNKNTKLKRDELSFPAFLCFDLSVWVSYDTATEEEKEKHKKEIATSGGFFKTLSYKDAFRLAWDKASEEEHESVAKLPNFNAKIFYEISGIKV